MPISSPSRTRERTAPNLWRACVAVIVFIRAFNRLQFPVEKRIANPAPENGMFSSIQCAARWTGWDRALTHFALALGDQPQISFAAIAQLCRFAAQNPLAICQPSRDGRPKHPVIFPRNVFEQLALTAVPTLRDFFQLSSFAKLQLPLDDPTLDFDLDTPEDYASARRRFLTEFKAGPGDTPGSAPPPGS